MLNAEPPELGFMLPQSRYSFGPPHKKIVAPVLFFPARFTEREGGGGVTAGVRNPASMTLSCPNRPTN